MSYKQAYQQAYQQYIHGNYSEAATLIDPLIEAEPEDANLRLLRGHIYSGLQKYDIALAEYETIQGLTADPAFLDYANQGIATCQEFTNGGSTTEADTASEAPITGAWHNEPGLSDSESSLPDMSTLDDSLEQPGHGNDNPDWLDLDDNNAMDGFNFDNLNFDAMDEADVSSANPFAMQPDAAADATDDFVNPFETANLDLEDHQETIALTQDDNPFWVPDDSPPGVASFPTDSTDFAFPERDTFPGEEETQAEADFEAKGGASPLTANGNSAALSEPEETLFMMGSLDPEADPNSELDMASDLGRSGSVTPGFDDSSAQYSFESSEADFSNSASAFSFQDEFEHQATPEESFGSASPAFGDDEGEQTFFMVDPSIEDQSMNWTDDTPHTQSSAPTPFPEPATDEQTFVIPPSSGSMGMASDFSLDDFNTGGFDTDDFLGDFSGDGGQKTPAAYAHQSTPASATPPTDETASPTEGADFLDEFDDFADFGNLDDFAISDDSTGFTTPDISPNFDNPATAGSPDTSELVDFGDATSAGLGGDTLWNEESVPAFTQTEIGEVEPSVNVEQGTFAFLENSSFTMKRWIVAGVAGVTAGLCVLTTNVLSSARIPAEEQQAVVRYLKDTGWIMLSGSLLGSFGATFLAGELILRQARRSTQHLQLQMSRVTQGDFNAQATVYSEDEFGRLATSFNQMSRVILTTTKEATRKAEEQEQQKEDLQRQVIRLLDDVEGAARGDLTVQAEVTADVLGAVADSFNLTIQNLREIVQQVKNAALQVNKASSDNETFARSLSSDALRQAEELAVTLNSVQVMTDSIQRVAESAREAEEVARTASATALRGGEAVEQTVAGILRIRETVAETTRKVKRLAESSQEISKIVALISQIASRTNLLALNASIEAARAGEAGRGFAIVADEVRQLADRAAKASKEIEQIVLQIQSETGSVMTAMEEGTQQVIEGTKLAEQAKRSLEDIIQVSNRIDQLVRSITADTVEQTETSRAVAQVMQSVELTAQETSQEAQRVSRSLQNLVGIARDLQTSVERFRVETSAE